MGYGENYQDLTRNLGDTIYKLNYQEFVQAVETLIDDISANDLDNPTTQKWMTRIFTIITVVAEGARNKIVSLSYQESIRSYAPITTPSI